MNNDQQKNKKCKRKIDHSLDIHKTTVIAIILITAFFSNQARAQFNKYTTPPSTPVGSATVPPSAYTPPRVNDINQDYTGRSGNLIITGNVPGQRFFRGFVPYNSTSQLSLSDGDLGISSLNSFIRRSSGSPYVDYSSGAVQPFYLPSNTVTSLNRGNQSGLIPPQVTFSGGTGRFEFKPFSQTDIYSLQNQPRPLSMEDTNLEEIIARQLELDEILNNQTQQQQALELDQPGQLQQSLIPDSMLPTTQQQQLQTLEDSLAEEMSQLIEEYKVSQTLQPEDTQQEKPYPPEITNVSGIESKTLSGQPLPLKPQGLGDINDETYIEAEIKYKKFIMTKYIEYLKSAAQFIDQGKYYRAADAYTMANIINEAGIEAIAGRAHALFAAGEYMSSAFYIKQAIAASPDFLKTPTLITTLKDKDMIENRLIDLVKHQMITKNPELAFLLAYVLYNKEDYEAAKQYVDIAAQKMPDSPQVKALKKTIEDAA